MITRRSKRNSQAVRFVLDGQVVTVSEPSPTMTVLEYLRDVLHRTGTKEGCAEGDCGACTVALGSLDQDGRQVSYSAINSCIRFLPTIDGCELVTVESLQAPDGALHPVQNAMIDHHASQCGFCTPGFVMSLFTLYLQGPSPSRERILETLSGNLCRCTGYRPIIEAATRMGDYPAPLRWDRDEPRSPVRRSLLESIKRRHALELPGFQAPRTVDELAAALDRKPDALILAGGTDVGLWVTKQLKDLPPIIYLGEVADLKEVRCDAGGLVIGAAASLTEAWSAIVAAHPTLRELAERFGSPPVRNSGTLCGNLANGSPIADSIPILIVLGAELELRRGARTRRLALESLYLGYQLKAFEPGEFIVSVRVPAANAAAWVAGYKLSKRFDQDISAVCAAFAVEVTDGRIARARVAFGGMAAIPSRALATENALIGASWSASTIESAAAALAREFTPLTDMRASQRYRAQCAKNLLRRFYLEHSGGHCALRVEDVPTETL